MEKGDGTPVPVGYTNVNMSVAGTADEIISTTADLDHFFRTLLSDDLLRPADLHDMTTDTGDDSWGHGPEKATLPRRHHRGPRRRRSRLPPLLLPLARRHRPSSCGLDRLGPDKDPAEFDPLSRAILAAFAEVVGVAGRGPVADLGCGPWPTTPPTPRRRTFCPLCSPNSLARSHPAAI
ncbi:hypothetical protein ACIPC1_32705 [Streptomyces sp. NPDC087263]|uniref:hypothetical protein n=1 Tax=Streptomyces sp. NPDC087263 TaxID=3365773 RepID=UPI003806B573